MSTDMWLLVACVAIVLYGGVGLVWWWARRGRLRRSRRRHAHEKLAAAALQKLRCNNNLVVANRDNAVVLIPTSAEKPVMSRVVHYVYGRDGKLHEVASLPVGQTVTTFDVWESWGRELLQGSRYVDGLTYPKE